MKTFQKGLRALIAAGSVAGFLSAWILLGHTGSATPVQTLPAVVSPAPFVSALPNNSAPPVLQPLPQMPRSGLVMRPRLRTGGS
jgi:hypothetical protein